ncbi:MAG: hypothetical protein IJ859_09285 [Synergistaceae bacterium]|nr:hypothetical protein [Synergistaceae bacterium]
MNILRNFLRRSFQNTRKFRRLDLREHIAKIHEFDCKPYTFDEVEIIDVRKPSFALGA